MNKTWNAGRVLVLTLGVLVLLPGLGLLGGGGVLLGTHWFSRSDGFVVSPEERFGADGYALASDRVDLDAGPDWLPLPAALFGSARIEVTGTGPDDVFVGIAPAADAMAYLEGVARTAVDGLGFDGPPTGSDQMPGDEPPGPPGEQGFWTAQATGPGGQHVRWDPADGEWMLVIMNADGSAGVDVRARIGARFPALGGLGWGVLIAGTVVTLLAVLLLVLAVRRPSDRPLPPPPAAAAVPMPRGPTAPAHWPPPAGGRPVEHRPAPASDGGPE